jgi:hypothetical protein
MYRTRVSRHYVTVRLIILVINAVNLVTTCTAKFNIQKFYFLTTQCMYVFCVDLRTNSYYYCI